jgi:hypothetical protein
MLRMLLKMCSLSIPPSLVRYTEETRKARAGNANCATKKDGETVDLTVRRSTLQ